MAYTLALLRTRADWTSRDCCRHECVGRAERGDSAHGPIAQRRTPAQTHTQAGMKRQARRPLNRIRSHRIGKVWRKVGVLYRSEQRGGRTRETAFWSDSPIMAAQACESRRAQPCQGQGLGACIALALAQKKALERGSCRGGELSNRRPSTGPRRWAGQLSTEDSWETWDS